MNKCVLFLCISFTVFLCFTSCQKKGLDSLQQEALFSIDYGRGEDELTFYHKSGMELPDARLAMAGGLIYVSSTQSSKIMKYNSYGDLIALFYNSDKNPEPVLLSTDLEDGYISTKQAFSYPLNDIGDLSVTLNHTILIQDEIIAPRQEFDPELNVMLDQIVLRFAWTGELIDFLGQEGSGGTPFPYIERLDTTQDKETVVYCRTPVKWIIYWFTETGYLKYKVDFDLRSLPLPEKHEQSIPSIGTIICDREEPLLYVKIDYYEDKPDELSEGKSGIQFASSYTHIFDLEKEQYVRQIEVPKHFKSQSSIDVLSFEKIQMIYRFFGVSNGGHLFFMAPSEGNYYELMILTADGKVIKRVKILLNDSENIHRDFFVTAEGIICGLICEEFGANIVWWRTDQYIEQDDEQRKLFK